MSDDNTTKVPEEPQPEGDVSDATPEGSDLESGPDDEPETFPRAYVEQLRNENAKYRQRAQEGDLYAQRLHTELVRATGKLADPTDLPFDLQHLEGDNLSLALGELLQSKPHLAARKPIGEIGQGATPSGSSVDLAAILRGKAG